MMLEIMSEQRRTPRLRELLVNEFLTDPALMLVAVEQLGGNEARLELRHDPLAVTAATFNSSTLKPQCLPKAKMYDVPPLDSWSDERYASFPVKRSLPPVLTLSSSSLSLLECNLSTLSLDRLADLAQQVIELRNSQVEAETEAVAPKEKHASPRLEPRVVAAAGQRKKMRAYR